jgi:transposase-like protein
MPWQEMSIMGERREFVRLAMQEGANRRELCRRFGISPDVGYKWIQRWKRAMKSWRTGRVVHIGALAVARP